MKVIHLISGGDTGGAKTHVHSLLKGLNEHIQADMVCFTDGPFVEEARELGLSVEVIAGSNPLSTLKPLKEKILAGGYDIIHCHGARGNMMGALLQKSTGLPVVTTVHSDPKLDYMGRFASNLTYGTINKWALRRFRYHIGVSDAMVDMLIERGFDPQQTFAIYNGLTFDTPTPAMTRKDYLSSLGLDWPEDAVIAGIAARLNPVKDMATLVRGFAAAHREQPQLRLIIAGDGPDEAMLRRLAEELGVKDEVCFAGWVSDTESFYNALDINTLTSLSETFPYALTEGARYALPTVATRVGGVPYLIEHGVTGLLLEAGDHQTLGRHLAALASDPSLRKNLGNHLLDKARKEYSLDSTIRRQLDIYETILRRHTRPKNRRDGVILCGAYGRDNAGDEAILKAILTEMRTLDPDMPLWVMTRKPKFTRLTYRANAVYTFNVPAFCSRMKRSKLYINGGGSLIQDVTSRRSLWFYLYTLSAARKMGCKVMMYGCGIGPVQYPENRKLAAKIINNSVDAITLRDSSSQEELRDMGVTVPSVVTADPTVILPSASTAVADGLLESAGLRPGEGQKYLGITVRPWPGFEGKASVFAEAADYAYDTYGLIPVFIPIEPKLDVNAAQQVASRLESAPCAILPGAASAENVIALFSRMEVVLSMRLHALVFAAGHGVPLVGAVYDPKVSAFLDAAGQDLYTPLEELTADTLKAHLDAAVARAGDRALREDSVRKLRVLEGQNSIRAGELLDLS